MILRLELSSMEDMLDTRDKATMVMKIFNECMQKGEVSAMQLTKSDYLNMTVTAVARFAT